MKNYLLLALVLLGGLLPAKADEPKREVYILAIGLGNQRPMPASLRLSVREGKQVAELHLNHRDWVAPITLRDVPRMKGNPIEKMFDAIFVADDGLSSIVVTGRFFDFEVGRGDGQISIHSAAKIAASEGGTNTPGSLTGGLFTFERLTN